MVNSKSFFSLARIQKLVSDSGNDFSTGNSLSKYGTIQKFE